MLLFHYIFIISTLIFKVYTFFQNIFLLKLVKTWSVMYKKLGEYLTRHLKYLEYLFIEKNK